MLYYSPLYRSRSGNLLSSGLPGILAFWSGHVAVQFIVGTRVFFFAPKQIGMAQQIRPK